MQKFLLYIVAIFVLFFACTQDQESGKTETSASTTSVSPSNAPGSVSPTPISEPKTPVKPNYPTVPQAQKSDLKYPKEFLEKGISPFKGAAVLNNIMIDNAEGKYGRRIKLFIQSDLEEVKKHYAGTLEKSGWAINPKMTKADGDEDIKYYTTNYTKEDYTLLLTIIETPDGVNITHILKEN